MNHRPNVKLVMTSGPIQRVEKLLIDGVEWPATDVRVIAPAGGPAMVQMTIVPSSTEVVAMTPEEEQAVVAQEAEAEGFAPLEGWGAEPEPEDDPRTVVEQATDDKPVMTEEYVVEGDIADEPPEDARSAREIGAEDGRQGREPRFTEDSEYMEGYTS